MKQLKIAINCQLIPGGISGGVEQFVMGLVYSLGKLKDGNEKYLLITNSQAPYWLKPYKRDNQVIVPRPWSGKVEHVTAMIKSMIRRFPLIRNFSLCIYSFFRKNIQGPPQSNGFWESLGVDIVHFPYQSMELTKVPSIFNPHDLQHLHYPEFFTSITLAWRETIYPAGCRHARAVAVESQWVKDDLVRQYGIDTEKIYVIPEGSPTELYEPITDEILSDVKQKFCLPKTFALYPAQTWPHKNHIRLLEAIALLRDQHDLSMNLVCTGKRNRGFWPAIARRIHDLKLENQVQFIGYVSNVELRGLYRLAEFVVIPSLFEAGSFPMLEAFREGTPVACSAVTSLPEQAGDAALFFDATSVESIAEAVRRIDTDAELRADLRQRGNERIKLFTWEKTARAYRALYRKVAGRQLSEEDEFLLANDWTRASISDLKE